MSPAGGTHDQLRQQIRNRALIERAETVLSAQLGCTRPEAFELIVSIARRMAVRPVDVAADLVGYTAGYPAGFATGPATGQEPTPGPDPVTGPERVAPRPEPARAEIPAITLFRLVAQAAWEPAVVLTPIRDGSGTLTDLRVAAASAAATGIVPGRTLTELGPAAGLP